jgi:uncharacterized protein HemX
MKFTTALTVALLLATANFGFVNQANAQEAQQESAKEQIENSTQPQGWCRWWPC